MSEVATSPTHKLWSIDQILLGSILSGPFGGCFFISQNFKVLGERKRAKKTLWVGLILSILVLSAGAFLPESITEKVPRTVIPIAYSCALMYFASAHQKERIKSHLEQKGKKHSYFKLFGFSILFLVLTFGVGVIIGSLSEFNT